MTINTTSEPAEATADRMAYEGAREDMLMWKRRALEAERQAKNLSAALAEEVNGPTFMGEPVTSTPGAPVGGDVVRDAWKCDRCSGDGWHWNEEEGCEPRDKVATKAHCDQCDGLGWCGPDAFAAANQAKEKSHV